MNDTHPTQPGGRRPVRQARPSRSPVGWQPATPSRTSRPPISGDLLAALTHRLTPRDRWLLHALHEHRVLTSTHITALLFGSVRAANIRLQTLHQLRAVDRFRPLVPVGSAPWHHVLDEAGAIVLAAHSGLAPVDIGYRRDRLTLLAHSARLAHLVGVNTLFTALVAHARTHPPARLAAWWSEQRCAAVWGDLARPDGYGRWHDPHGVTVDFFLEYDTGSEPLGKVAGKLDGYGELAATTHITSPLLIRLQTPGREADLHQHLATRGSLPVPVATSNTLEHPDPAGPVWQPTNHHGGRVSLGGLADHFHLPTPPAETTGGPNVGGQPFPERAPIGLAPAWQLPAALPTPPPLTTVGDKARRGAG